MSINFSYKNHMNAVVLLSGGLDSTTVLKIVQNDGYTIFALTFNYGQKHLVEIEAAKNICKKYGILNHCIANIDIKSIGGSALTNDDLIIRKNTTSNIDTSNIPLTYVPARNTIFLSYALGYAEVVRASKIFIGINALDYSGYPDCRPEYLQKFNELAKLATAVGVNNTLPIEVCAPLLNLTKAEIIKVGLQYGINYEDTISCYEPYDNQACGKCDACVLRFNGFKNANVEDYTKYTKN